MAGPLATRTDLRISRISMTAETARLQLAQYLSPAFPTGGFAWSQGLEWAMDQGVVTRGSFPDWLADVLEYGSLWTDAVLLSLSLRDNADHVLLDDLARAACLSSQRLSETVEQGTAFAANMTVLGLHSPPMVLPVAFGRACCSMPLPASEIIAQFLQAQIAALASAAVRFMPLGPQDGQRILAGLHPTLLATAARAATATEADLATAAWGADIAALSHETMTVRIFRS
ncbi:urease accessory protein UreF [Falsirhodobacter sp. alg1]|uniref:urease accessory protein UreF n=1 Tax=Falsirhodobacter sp. alg1 TaxID=1472418 RepID=UPI001EDC3560|nr:urease accessory UreF family protein [Falsirhodobacter sp. alg1]